MFKGYESEISKIYSTLRDNETKALRSRKEEIKRVIPEVFEIEKEISKASISLAMTALKNEGNVEKSLKDIREKITDLRIKEAELLTSKGYPINYLEPQYTCNNCKDTGYINNNIRCSCYKKYMVHVYYKNSQLKDILRENNFDNFNINLFSNHKSDNVPVSPRKNIEKIWTSCSSYVKNFKNSNENLLFYGDSGTGKTFMSNCIAKELLDCGFLVVYRTADELIKNLREIVIEGNKDLEKLLIECDLLIIDDLGTEQKTDFSRSELFNLLNKKLLKRNKMLISTNLSPEDILKNYTERISSRLLGNFNIFKFYGEDLRIAKNLGRIN
ncbi:ATP-binding protein [Clostridium cellulovorans]|uniref:Sigma 54 interacting domain protein n=1 Tax=Clostridium cellulovorans (strain ATCC 35296 / DSM 3052 / OCM 3 / 743B) TaxID=573061 RepID=D9SPA2_CLOC7|nr:ATP-binding protein [Clostridium cellulovorans]ADL54004.1 Sigma 54 interacting domain protein [Clostridium cellulovorans 743B]